MMNPRLKYTIGDRTVLVSETAIIPKGKTAAYETQLDGYPLTFSIQADDDTPESEAEPIVKWNSESNAFKITLQYWNRPLPGTLTNVVEIAKTKTTRYSCQIAVQSSGPSLIVHFQIYSEAI